MNQARIGLIGAGWIGSEHARNLAAHPKAQLVAIADVNRANAEKVKNNHAAEAAVLQDYQKLLERDDIDAVFICSPNALHAEMTVAAVEAGKHVMCEKPMAITLGDCQRIRQTVTARGVKYLIGYHRRFNPLYEYVKVTLDQGLLGKPVFIESDYIHHIPSDWPIWEWLGKEDVAGSIFHAGSGHNVDLLRFFCGEIAEVACFKDISIPRKVQIETEDVAIATFRFVNGAIGKVLFQVGGIMPFRFHFALYGTRGSVQNNRIWMESFPRFDEPGFENDCLELPASWIPDNVQGGISETWHKLDDHFVEMLTQDAPSLNDVNSAYRTSEVCFAVLEAARKGEVVRLVHADGN